METSQHFPKGISPRQEPTVLGRQLLTTTLLDRTIALVGIIFSTNTLGYLFGGIGVPGTALTAIRYLLPLLIVFRLLARWQSTLRILQSDLFLLGFNVIVFASFMWSIDPALTITGLRAEYVQAFLIAIFLAARFTMAQQVRLITVGLGFTAIASFLFILFIPGTGVHQDIIHLGSWRGLYGHKNLFSTAVVTLLAICLGQVIDSKEREAWHIPLIGLCVLLLILSTSRTGIVLLIAVLATMFIYRRFRWRGMKTLLIIYLGIIAAAFGLFVLIVAWDQILIGLGRDPTLTGRTPIWALLRNEFIPEKLFFGYGRGSFWYNTEVIQSFATQLVFVPTHAHNGWYDLFIDVGLVGVILYACSAVQAWVRTFRLAYVANTAACIWPLAFFTVMHLNNYTESLMLTRTNFLWVFYMAICWSLKEAIRDERRLKRQSQEYSPKTASMPTMEEPGIS